MKRAGWGMLRWLALVPAWALAQQAGATAVVGVGELLGAETWGRAEARTLVCTTCPVEQVVLSQSVDGGVGSNSSSVSYGGNPDAGYVASARYVGSDALPELKAAATANVQVGDPLGVTYNDAVASASAVQAYAYSGSDSLEYQMAYSVDGVLLGGDRNYVSASISVYDVFGYNPCIECGGDGPLASDYLYFDGETNNPPNPARPFVLDGILSFTLNPGDMFYVFADLFVSADSWTGSGYVDAANTMTVHFTAGDTSLLTPLLNAASDSGAVPMPGGWLLLLSGALAWRVWSRRC